MANRSVRKSGKNSDDDITEFGESGARWSPLGEAAMRDIEVNAPSRVVSGWRSQMWVRRDTRFSSAACSRSQSGPPPDGNISMNRLITVADYGSGKDLR